MTDTKPGGVWFQANTTDSPVSVETLRDDWNDHSPMSVETLRDDWNDHPDVDDAAHEALIALPDETLREALDTALRPYKDMWHFVLDSTRADATEKLLTVVAAPPPVPATAT